MKKKYIATATILATVLALTGCKKKELFDPQVYDDIITQNFPISPVDANHRWTTVTRRMVSIRVNGGIKDMHKLQVLSDHPADSRHAEIMAELDMPAEGNSYSLVFAAPIVQTTFYAAIKTTDGHYYVAPFTADSQQADFTTKTDAGTTATLKYQAFTYCFEDSYPKPDDYDFNDCVVRISLEPGIGLNQVKMNVTLAAAGTYKPMAAAVRLLNCGYNDVRRVELVGGQRFDVDYPLPYSVLTDTQPLLRGRNGEAVVRLFDDAAWCMARNSLGSTGTLDRYMVNVTRTAGGRNLQMTAITRTYLITFEENSTFMVPNFCLDNIDPFVITSFNGACWETHQYVYRDAMVLYEYSKQTDNNMTWALCIPNDTYRWPLEGLLIGTQKNGLLTGAYREPGHSFGGWAAARNSNRDWFLFPTASEVY